MKRLLILLAGFLLAGCATVAKVDQGQQTVADRLQVDLQGPWNRLASGGIPTWTVDGFTVDRLQFFVGIKDGEPIAARPHGADQQRPLTFHASMKAHEIVALFEGLYTQDGSTFTLERIEPFPFLGDAGFKFRYAIIRRGDDVRLSGVGYGAVRDSELTVISYSAPRLGFFPRYQDQVETMARSARLKS
jgi:hypothetical protein